MPDVYDTFVDAPSHEADAPARPTVIAGRFEMQRMLGKGGMGAVYQCYDQQLGRQVAMKLLLPNQSNSPGSVQRFLGEARAVAAITHQNVIQVYDVIDDGPSKYIVMEYVHGETLSARLERERKLSVREITRIMLQIGLALETAHRCGIVHRDIKPANIMLTETGAAKLGDFGIAQLFGQEDLTRTGAAMGTWVYAAPEQLKDAKHVDHRADIYSMGATIYEMATGQLPRKVDLDRMPSALVAVVKRCLAEEPADRFQTAGEFLRALTEAFSSFERHEAATVLAPEPSASSQAPAPTAPAPPQEDPLGPLVHTPARLVNGSGRMRRRTLWRSRGLPWSAPFHTAAGVALTVWAVSARTALDYQASTWLARFRNEILAGYPAASSVQADDRISLLIIDYLERVPCFYTVLAVGLWLLLVPPLRRLTTKYRLSTSRLSVRRGLLFRHERDFPLTEIQDVTVDQSLLGMLLNYGTVELSLVTGDVVYLRGVPSPSRLRDRLAAAR